jgi:hypothetical protein
MAASAHRGFPGLSSREQSHGIIQTVAAALVALTATDSLMILVNRSSLPQAVRMFAVVHGQWLFLPACLWVGWISRRLRHRRYLPLAGAYATAYLVLTQSRGAWIWHGTFDKYAEPKGSWLLPAVIGMGAAVAIPFTRRSDVQPTETGSWHLLIALTVAIIATALLAPWWPDPTEFAPTRTLALGGCLVALAAASFFAQRSE